MVDSSISYASLSALPPEKNYIQIVNYIMYLCWENKTLELEIELEDDGFSLGRRQTMIWTNAG